MTIQEISDCATAEIRNLFVRSIRCQLDERNPTTLGWLDKMKKLHKLADDADIEEVCSCFPICRMAQSLYNLSSNVRFIDNSYNSFAGIRGPEELSLALTVRGY